MIKKLSIKLLIFCFSFLFKLSCFIARGLITLLMVITAFFYNLLEKSYDFFSEDKEIKVEELTVSDIQRINKIKSRGYAHKIYKEIKGDKKHKIFVYGRPLRERGANNVFSTRNVARTQ